MISLLIYVLIAGLIFWLVWYLINTIPMLQPFRVVAYVILVVIAIIFLLEILSGGVGGLHPLLR